ncbi:hypothetical protein BUH_6439 [Burkholderia pseudomallei Pakistan 9]|nr:hypothetical protein BUH_6439 [Burkholderia pseudomallei Pakistan 9]
MRRPVAETGPRAAGNAGERDATTPAAGSAAVAQIRAAAAAISRALPPDVRGAACAAGIGTDGGALSAAACGACASAVAAAGARSLVARTAAGGRRVAAHRRAAARRDFAARARAARRMRVGAHPHARFDTRFDTRFGARSDARIPRVRAASRFAEPRAAEPQRERPVPRRMRRGHPARRARRLAVALRLFPRVGALRFGVVAVASVVALAERRAALLAIRALQIGRPPCVRLLRGLDARDDRRDRRTIADG